MPRVFLTPDNLVNNQVIITGKDLHHLRDVLRLSIGDTFNGVLDGVTYQLRIQEITHTHIRAGMESVNQRGAESPLFVHLYQGLPKGEKMDWIVQKATELGVAEITPVNCARTVVRLDEKKGRERTARWQRIAEEAAKQAGRERIPPVHEPLSFTAAVSRIEAGTLHLFPWEEEATTGLKSLLRTFAGRRLAVWIGPEGGFTGEEAEAARQRGACSVTLGPRILRTETAGLTVLSIIQYELGDMGEATWQK